MPVPVEACIDAASVDAVRRSVRHAYRGGAARVELCRDLTCGGLTPAPPLVRAARAAFAGRPGLLVMIRPRPGDFTYAADELAAMRAQIAESAGAGADGVVFGALKDGHVDGDAVRALCDAARAHGLSVTFHRAFDAATDPTAALETLVDLGVDRILTSGTPWGTAAGALDGVARLAALVRQAGRRVEIVVGGGLHPGNVGAVLARLPLDVGRVSVHAFSGVRQDGFTDATRVASMVRRARIGGEEAP